MDNAPNNAWERFKGDFNAMTDEQIDRECEEAQERIDKDEEWLEAVSAWVDAGKPRGRHRRPIAIWHDGDNAAYQEATEEEQNAWDSYANQEAQKVQDTLDAYETVAGLIGTNRDGKITNWCPPKFFPEWLESYRKDRA